MPQMMPINWIFLFTSFIIIFILFNIMNYFVYNIKFNNNKMIKNFKFNNINWKW